MEPYAHERVCPIPLYVKDVGVAPGMYKELVEQALAILNQCDPDIRKQAWFDPQLVEELAIDPRAYDFDHPASKRPNHHFGQWDLHRVDNRGYYRRFVLQQITLDAMLTRVGQIEGENGRGGEGEKPIDRLLLKSPPLPISPSPTLTSTSGSAAPSRDELLFEAAAV